MKTRYIVAGCILGLVFCLGSCFAPESGAPDFDDASYELTTDEEWLYDNAVETFDQADPATELSFTDEVQTAAGGAKAAERRFFRMFKIARLKASEDAGDVLQAADVAIAGEDDASTAYVAYVMVGSEWHGGVDVLELARGYYPKISSRLITKNDDVNSVSYDEATNRIYMGLNVNPDLYTLDGPGGAMLRVAALDENYKVQIADNSIVASELDLASYAANDVALHDGKILVPVGAAGGGLEVVAVTADAGALNLEREAFIEYADVRAVAACPDFPGADFAVYKGPDDGTPDGTDAKLLLYTFDDLESQSAAVPIPGAAAVETKAALEVHGNVAFLAASDAGMAAVDLSGPNVLFTIPNPDSTDALPADKLTCNDVTIDTPEGSDKSVLFIANGEYGVRAYDLGFKLEDETNITAALDGFEYETAYLGYLSFGTGNSANSLLFKNGYLFVGTGLGGVTIIRIFDKTFTIPGWNRPIFRPRPALP